MPGKDQISKTTEFHTKTSPEPTNIPPLPQPPRSRVLSSKGNLSPNPEQILQLIRLNLGTAFPWQRQLRVPGSSRMLRDPPAMGEPLTLPSFKTFPPFCQTFPVKL